uniref:Uncharacterized protein n=1 Tax=Triticum urartu TaxID=4572 RepID=A0A8R7PKR6_TRIUA
MQIIEGLITPSCTDLQRCQQKTYGEVRVSRIAEGSRIRGIVIWDCN